MKFVDYPSNYLGSGVLDILNRDRILRYHEIPGRKPCERFPSQIHDNLYQLRQLGVVAHAPPHLLRQQRQQPPQLHVQLILGKNRTGPGWKTRAQAGAGSEPGKGGNEGRVEGFGRNRVGKWRLLREVAAAKLERESEP